EVEGEDECGASADTVCEGADEEAAQRPDEECEREDPPRHDEAGSGGLRWEEDESEGAREESVDAVVEELDEDAGRTAEHGAPELSGGQVFADWSGCCGHGFSWMCGGLNDGRIGVMRPP